LNSVNTPGGRGKSQPRDQTKQQAEQLFPVREFILHTPTPENPSNRSYALLITGFMNN
jgi:hypothetical protein